MTNGTKRQLIQAGGTLTGWTLAQVFDKKDTVPFTVIGGLLAFIIGEEMTDKADKRRAKRPLSGVSKPKKKQRS